MALVVALFRTHPCAFSSCSDVFVMEASTTPGNRVGQLRWVCDNVMRS